MSTWKNLKVSEWANFVQNWLLPPTCLVCNKPGQPGVDLCGGCQGVLPIIESPCFTCGLALPPHTYGIHCGRCMLRDSLVTRTISAFAYQDPVDRLIGRFKYERKLPSGRMLSELLAETIALRYQQDSLPQLLIPVPLHAARLRQRGYNQAQLIAKDLGLRLRIPVASHLLQRTRATPAQQGLRARERKRNLRGAFEPTPAWQPESCTRIALVDDVVTTMSTVREIAGVLRRACNTPPEVHVWCLARA